MSETPESPFLKFVRSTPDYPNCSESNILLFEFIRTHGNDFTSLDSFAKAWAANREEIIQAVSCANAKRFLVECPAFIANEFNAGLLDSFVADQVGRERPWSVENYWQAYEFLQSTGQFAVEIEYTEPAKKPAPIHPAQSLADAMAAREAEEAKIRKLSPIGKPVSEKLRALATKERRDGIERLSHQDKFPEAVHI